VRGGIRLLLLYVLCRGQEQPLPFTTNKMYQAWFQAFAAELNKIFALPWCYAANSLVIYWRFGITYRSAVSGQGVQETCHLKVGPIGYPATSKITTNLRCIGFHKNEGVKIYHLFQQRTVFQTCSPLLLLCRRTPARTTDRISTRNKWPHNTSRITDT